MRIIRFHDRADGVKLRGEINSLFVLQYSFCLIFVGLCSSRTLQLLCVKFYVRNRFDFCSLKIPDRSHALRFTEHDSCVICERIFYEGKLRQQLSTLGCLKECQKVVQLPVDLCQLGADICKKILAGCKRCYTEHLEGSNCCGIDLIQRCTSGKTACCVYHCGGLTALMEVH